MPEYQANLTLTEITDFSKISIFYDQCHFYSLYLIWIFLKACAWFNWYFYELLFFRVWTGYTHPSIGNQAFWTGYTKSVNFIRYQALRTAFTWAIIRYCFVCFAFKTCCPFTVWKWALWAHFTVACDINNMIKRWTMLTFSSMGP